MHYGFPASRTASLRLPDWPREDYLFGPLRLLVARRGHSDTAIHCATTDISPNGASQGHPVRAKWHRQELPGRKVGPRFGRFRQRYERCHGGRHVQRGSQIQQRTQAISRAHRRKMRFERSRRATKSDHPREPATRCVSGRIVQRPPRHQTLVLPCDYRHHEPGNL